MPDPDKSKIKVTAQKMPLLIMTDWGATGFGTVGLELAARMAEMEVFDIHYLGWFSRPEHKVVGQQNGFTLHNTAFWDQSDNFGKGSFDHLVGQIKPRVVLTLGDPWMVEHVIASQHRQTFNWVCYMPIDRDVLSKNWRKMMRRPEVLVLYSQFGMTTVEEQIPFRNPQLILHGVDRMLFKPWYPEGMDEDTPIDELMRERKRITLGAEFADKWIIGFMGRNQIRKAIPRHFRAFKAFNCDTWCNRKNIEVLEPDGSTQVTHEAEEFCNNIQKFRCDVCPAFKQRPETEHSILYLHSSRGDGKDPQDKPGVGWLVDELGERYQIQGRIGMTPSYDVIKGIPRAGVAQLLNCWDVHLFMSHSEGFGLPIVEGLACGCPTLVTNYSSMPELVKDGGGYTIDVKDYDTFVTWENDWANADIGSAADLLNKLFMDEELYASVRKDAANNRYTPTWNDVAMQFRNLILQVAKS